MRARPTRGTVQKNIKYKTPTKNKKCRVQSVKKE